MRVILVALIGLMTVLMVGCQSTPHFGVSDVRGNEGGSDPLNDQEAYEIQKAVNRCHRTGGTRVVKIKGELRCY